jgi:hypothetical protein
MRFSIGPDNEDRERLIGTLRSLGRFGRRLDEITEECARDLEALTADTTDSQRADDDGMPPSD